LYPRTHEFNDKICLHYQLLDKPFQIMPIIASIDTYAYAFVDVPLKAGIDVSDLFFVCTIFQSMLTGISPPCEFLRSGPALSIVEVEQGLRGMDLLYLFELVVRTGQVYCFELRSFILARDR
jgi:hypothetical protein